MTRDLGQLSDVLLANNPKPTAKTGWSNLSRREYDVLSHDHGSGNWSVACNLERIGPGTVGWIYRADGSFGHLAALIVFEDQPYPLKEPGGVVHYCDGLLWRLPREWWVDGARIRLDAGWSGRSPFGKMQRFRNGEELKAPDRAVLFTMLHPVAKMWLADQLAPPE
jgi:hypothetical protein